jgi:hypothetical protein
MALARTPKNVVSETKFFQKKQKGHVVRCCVVSEDFPPVLFGKCLREIIVNVLKQDRGVGTSVNGLLANLSIVPPS